jgi:membrane fusion protein, multidrug efflux system
MNTSPSGNDETQYGSFVRAPGAIGGWLAGLWQDKPRLHRLAMIWGTVLVVGVSLFVWLSSGRYTGTDNAYVRAAKLMVTTDVSGMVKTVEVKQGQHVKKGQVLFTLDPEPFEHAVAEDEADLSQTALDLAAMKAAYRGLIGQVEAQEAQVLMAETTFRRDRALARGNAVSAQQLDQARSDLQSAQATLVSLKQSAKTQLAKLNGDPDLPAERYPGYLKAKATLAEAQRQLDHTVVRAPFEGDVGEVDSLQPGILVVSSLSSFSTTSAVGLVATEDMWVSADMKETDLAYVREGYPVEFTVDTYPGQTWHGTVDAISRASDSAFSVLPSENSSANWVKVVQRIPVRIKIAHRPSDPPLRAGMSAVISIDTHHRRWWRMLYGD